MNSVLYFTGRRGQLQLALKLLTSNACSSHKSDRCFEYDEKKSADGKTKLPQSLASFQGHHRYSPVLFGRRHYAWPTFDHFLPYLTSFPLFTRTASFTSAFSAFSSSLAPSGRSMARRTLPSRLALNNPDGSANDAPLAKVSLTVFL